MNAYLQGRLAPNVVFLVTIVALTGCGSRGPEVVLFTSLDRPHSEPILRRFEERTGIRVRAVYDVEKSKTLGLVNRLLAERSNPRADVFWNSEATQTLVLQQRGVLASYRSPEAAAFPVAWKDPDGFWSGFAARGRVILVNTNLVPDPPVRIADLTNGIWRGKVALADPRFGTTSTHMSALCAEHGPARLRQLLSDLKNNGVVITPGNATARDMVAAGEIPICLTDTDDAYGALAAGRPVAMIIPDQGPEESGWLLIPNTVALVAGGPNPEQGKRLIDFLLSSEVEEMLAASDSMQIPLRPGVRVPEHVASAAGAKAMQVDFGAAAAAWSNAAMIVQAVF